MSDEHKAWKTYEEVAAYLLNQIATEFGLERFEGKQKVIGQRSRIEWEIDAKGIGEENEIFFIVECRRTKSRQKQEQVGALAYRISDTGAKGGIFVSPLGLQKGAVKLAQAENIYSVILDKKSTCTEYILKFLNKVRFGKHLEGKLTLKSSLEVLFIRGNGAVKS